MKNLKQVVCTVVLVPIISAFTLYNSDDESAVTYFSGSLSEAQEWAKSQGKFSIAFFHAKWCAPCQIMEEYTLRDPDLAAYINQNYISTTIDIEQFDGVQARQENNIKLLPTVMVFDENGQTVARYEEKMNASELLSELKRINPAPSVNDEDTYYLPATASVYSPAPVYTPPPRAEKVSSNVTTADNSKVAISFKPVKGFGVQTACYSNKELAVEDLRRTGQRFADDKIMLFASKFLSLDRYFLLIGPFATREQADAKKKRMQAEGIECFTKDLMTIPKSILK